MIENRELRKALAIALENGDVESVRQIITDHPRFLSPDCPEFPLGTLLHYAAAENNLAIVQMLVDEFGMNINVPDRSFGEGPIATAATFRANKVARWLLKRGAIVDTTRDGMPCCGSLVQAIIDGNLELVRLLVEHGANINAYWGCPDDGPRTPLTWAMMYHRLEIVDYLRSKGGLEAWQLGLVPKPDYVCDSVLEHIEKHLGRPSPLSLQEIVPGDPQLVIHRVPPNPKLAELNGKCQALVTSGMSARPMTVPPGGGEFRFAELVVYLPIDWPLDDQALRQPKNFWPIDWLRRIARYPHENHTWLGGRSAVIANGEPPAPLGPDVRFTCWLVMAEPPDFGRMQRSDGEWVTFYGLYPLYTEERDLEKQHGTQYIIELFEKYRFPAFVNPMRPNLAYAPKK